LSELRFELGGHLGLNPKRPHARDLIPCTGNPAGKHEAETPQGGPKLTKRGVILFNIYASVQRMTYLPPTTETCPAAYGGVVYVPTF